MGNPWFLFGKWSANGGVSTSLCMFNRRFFRGWDRGPSLEVRCIPFISASPLHRWCAIGGQVGLLQSHKCPAYGITVSHISHVYIIIYTHIYTYRTSCITGWTYGNIWGDIPVGNGFSAEKNWSTSPTGPSKSSPWIVGDFPAHVWPQGGALNYALVMSK